jgi:hypothetical protein
MSDTDQASAQVELADVWRDAVEAGLRYWGRLGRLAVEGVAVFVPAVAELRPELQRDSPRAREASGPKTILVEAEAGTYGVGVFLLENTTAERLSIPVSVSPFVGEAGEVQPAVTFRPDLITLDPGDQQVVQVAVAVDETLEPDVRYGAEISVPGLSATRIPIVVRRRRTTTAPAAPARRNGQRAERPKGQTKAKTRAS